MRRASAALHAARVTAHALLLRALRRFVTIMTMMMPYADDSSSDD